MNSNPVSGMAARWQACCCSFQCLLNFCSLLLLLDLSFFQFGNKGSETGKISVNWKRILTAVLHSPDQQTKAKETASANSMTLCFSCFRSTLPFFQLTCLPLHYNHWFIKTTWKQQEFYITMPRLNPAINF